MASIGLPSPSQRGLGVPAVLAASVPARAISEDRRWLLPIALALYVLGTTWTWEFPNWQGIPFPPVWLGAALGGLTVWRRLGRSVGPIELAGIVAVAAMLLTAVTMFWSQPMRDLSLYLKAGDAWLANAPVYARVPLVEKPEDLSNYPFLYPPVTLPLFGALAVLPMPLAAAIWLGASLAAVVGGLRLLGVGWRWCVLLLAWPPIAQGLYVGNVAVPLFVLFAAAVARPGLLLVAPIFKVYSGIAALWLLRREHWRELVVGAAVMLAVVAASVAVTGLEIWPRWLEGLAVYQVSQRLLPEYLYGFGLARYVPLLVVAALAIAVTVLALRARERRDQLGRLGVATIVGSPSLFSHGWLVALPALLRLDTPWFWLAFGLTVCSPGPAWFVALAIVGASWFVPRLRKGVGMDRWHPLEAAAEPWPRHAIPSHRASPVPVPVPEARRAV